MSSRPVLVRPKHDVLGVDGEILVLAATEGSVIDIDEPPTSGRMRVAFPGDVNVWLKPEQVYFRDGALGALRAVLQFRNATLVDAEFTYVASRDIIIDNQTSFSGSSVDLKTDDGYLIRVSSNANNDIELTFLLDGTGQ